MRKVVKEDEEEKGEKEGRRKGKEEERERGTEENERGRLGGNAEQINVVKKIIKKIH